MSHTQDQSSFGGTQKDNKKKVKRDNLVGGSSTNVGGGRTHSPDITKGMEKNQSSLDTWKQEVK